MVIPNVRIVLVETSHPGNIGAAVRAMKTMGLHRLTLVRPKKFPAPEAKSRAAHAVDVLEQAEVVDDLLTAIADCQLVIGTSARLRKLPWPLFEPREAACFIRQQPITIPIAIVFGRESSGLTNEELASCHYQICIPTNPDYGILNLAAAVQIICYELFLAYRDQPLSALIRNEEVASLGEMEQFYAHLERVLFKLAFLDPKQPDLMMRRLRRFFNRGQPDKQELNMLRGILTACEQNPEKSGD